MSTAILLVHGFLTGPDDWDSLLPQLRLRYDEVSIFCQPGHARQDEPDKLDYKKFTHCLSYDNLKAELDRLFAAYTDIDIVGHSMGGAMALWAAAHYPVRKLSLLAPALRWPRIGIFMKLFFYRGKRKKFRKMKIAKEYEEALMAENDKYYEDYKQGRKILFSRLLPYWTPHNIAVLYKNTKKGQKEIKNVCCPVEILWGEFDELVPVKSIKKLIQKLPSRDITIVTYGNLGHSMMLSLSNKMVMRDVLCFLNGKKVEEVKPENPGEARYVTHAYAVDTGDDVYKQIKSLHTGTRIVGGRVELVEKESSAVVPLMAKEQLYKRF